MTFADGGTFSPNPPPLTPKVTAGGLEGPGPHVQMAGVAQTTKTKKNELKNKKSRNFSYLCHWQPYDHWTSAS